MAKPDRKAKAVREPIQVYLTPADRALLDRAARTAGVPRAEILRRGLRRAAAEVLAEESPVIGLLNEMAAAPWPAKMPTDVAHRHHEYLAETYVDTHKRKRR